MERGRLWCCRAGHPQAAVNIRKCIDRRGGVRAPRPTMGQGVRCAGRCPPRARLSPAGRDVAVGDRVGGGYFRWAWASTPTIRPRDFGKPCRGRRSRRPASFREGRLWCCRAGCPHPAVNIRQQFDSRSGAHGPRPTTLRKGLGRICRGDPMWSPVGTRVYSVTCVNPSAPSATPPFTQGRL